MGDDLNFQTVIQALEKSLLDRIDRSDVFVTNNINALKIGLDDMRREVNGMDKQIAVMSERQSRIGELDKLVKELDNRMTYAESERRKFAGILTFIKWIIGIVTGGGVITFAINYIKH